MIEQWFWHHHVCLVKTHRNMYSMTLKDQGQNLTSGQGHVMTQVGHVVSMRLDERNTMRPLSRLYLFWIKGYSQKTVGDLRWRQMTFGGSPMKTVAWVITEVLSQHHSQWMEMFRCEKEVVEILPIDLTWAGHEIDLTSGQEYKKSKIYNLLELLTSSTFKSLKTLVHNCGCGRVSKLLNFVLRWRHLTWPGDLTWYHLVPKFSHKMHKGWMNSYAKCGGAARRHFLLSAKNRWGGQCAPPAVRGLLPPPEIKSATSMLNDKIP